METTPWSPVRRRPINGRPNPTRTLKFSGLYEMNPYPSQKFARNKSVSVTCCVWFVDEIDHVYVFVKRNNSKAPEKLYPQKLLKPFNSETPHLWPSITLWLHSTYAPTCATQHLEVQQEITFNYQVGLVSLAILRLLKQRIPNWNLIQAGPLPVINGRGYNFYK